VTVIYTIMSETARRLLYILASSAQSERDVGRTVTDMWSPLNENTVEALELLRWGMRAELTTNL